MDVRELLKIDSLAEDFTALSIDKEKAKQFLQQEDTPPALLLRSLEALLGGESLNYEPESIEIELANAQCPVSDSTWDKLLAAQTLMYNEPFYWEYGAFHNTILAFTNEPVIPSAVQVVTPCELAEGILAAEILRKVYHKLILDFDYEPQSYTATILKQEGYVICPPVLEFAQEALDLAINKEAKELQLKVKEKLKEGKFTDDGSEESIQLALYAAPYLHVRECVERWRRLL